MIVIPPLNTEQLINILTADVAFKLSSRVFKEEVIERRTNENEYNELELFERFLQLIQQDKNISERMKNCVLNHAKSLNRSRLPRNKRQKQKFIQERGFRTGKRQSSRKLNHSDKLH